MVIPNKTCKWIPNQLAENEPIVYTEEDMNEFAQWYIRNTGQYSSDAIALKRGDYLKMWIESKKEK